MKKPQHSGRRRWGVYSQHRRETYVWPYLDHRLIEASAWARKNPSALGGDCWG